MFYRQCGLFYEHLLALLIRVRLAHPVVYVPIVLVNLYKSQDIYVFHRE